MPHPTPISSTIIRYPNDTWREVQTMKVLIRQFSPASCFSRLCPNIHLGILFSKTSVRVLLPMKDTLFHTYTSSVRNKQSVCFNP